MDYIGISEDRIHHILNVARECYKLAKKEGFNEKECQRMFVLGFVHDIGYEFSSVANEHPYIGAKILEMIGVEKELVEAVKNHGNNQSKIRNIEWKILNTADMTIDKTGKKVTASERLDDIKARYGENSEQFKNSYEVSKQLRLLEKN